jgi:hypothetical protein
LAVQVVADQLRRPDIHWRMLVAVTGYQEFRIGEACDMRTIKTATIGRRIPDAILRGLLGCLMLVSCAGVLRGYEGTAARPENRLPLAAMSDKAAVWQGKDVAIHYTAAMAGGDLHISGSIERLGTIKHFSSVNAFQIYIHFLTTDGIIVASKLLWSAGPGIDSTLIRWTFDRHYPLPTGAAAVGFSYRGAFSDGGGGDHDGQTSWQVWQRP